MANIKVNTITNASFAVRYLNLFNKAASLGKIVELSISEEMPLVLKFEFEIGEIKYYLAPKVNDN